MAFYQCADVSDEASLVHPKLCLRHTFFNRGNCIMNLYVNQLILLSCVPSMKASGIILPLVKAQIRQNPEMFPWRLPPSDL